MSKILTFGASTSSKSINQLFAIWAANQLDNSKMLSLNLNNFEMPIYSMDKEAKSGIPDLAFQFKERIREADGIIISFAEHNGSYSAAFKNTFDWASRIKEKVWLEKPMLLLATSPGGRGGKSVLETAVSGFPHMGGNVMGSFALPSFYDNFDVNKGIININLRTEFDAQLAKFKVNFHNE